MLPYSQGIILDNANNYGIVKTEAVFGFGPPNHNNNDFNTTEPLQWIFGHDGFERRSLQANKSQSRTLKTATKKVTKASSVQQHNKKKVKSASKKAKKRKSKHKKCFIELVGNGKKKRRGGGKFKKHKKYMIPLILGLLAAKSLLIPIALKALAFLSAKGLMMGFFSTVMASVLSLKGMFDHSHGYQNRKDDTKTQVEIIQVPTKSDDHVYYDEHYKRGDYIPVISRFEDT